LTQAKTYFYKFDRIYLLMLLINLLRRSQAMRIEIVHRRKQGRQIFLHTIYQKREKTYQITTTLLNSRKIFQAAVIYSKRPKYIPNGHKIYQHCPF
jgi:hypothetical protein